MRGTRTDGAEDGAVAQRQPQADGTACRGKLGWVKNLQRMGG